MYVGGEIHSRELQKCVEVIMQGLVSPGREFYIYSTRRAKTRVYGLSSGLKSRSHPLLHVQWITEAGMRSWRQLWQLRKEMTVCRSGEGKRGGGKEGTKVEG